MKFEAQGVHGDDDGEAMSRIAVIGAGAWGTGLSIVLGRRGSHQVRLWAHEKAVRDSISTRRVNELFLPGQLIPESRLTHGQSAGSPGPGRNCGQRYALAALPSNCFSRCGHT